ncbi:MAG: zf-TFIIB domain-containing protein [Verrucomicrobiae bacterium]|nr:zf-TFIIB domain-containing protein [Verrucomicrobiae bacterium]
MNCPVDQGPMVVHKHGASSFHGCPKCFGVFFKLSHFAGLSQKPELRRKWTAVELPPRRVDSRGRNIPCPSCHGTMTCKIHHGVEVDVCQVCEAVWLDAGELAEIIDRFQARVLLYAEPESIPGQKQKDSRKTTDVIADTLADLVADPDMLAMIGDLASWVAEGTGTVAEHAGVAIADFLSGIFSA